MEFCTPRTTKHNKVQGLDNSHWFPEGDELDKNGYLKRNVEKQQKTQEIFNHNATILFFERNQNI